MAGEYISWTFQQRRHSEVSSFHWPFFTPLNSPPFSFHYLCCKYLSTFMFAPLAQLSLPSAFSSLNLYSHISSPPPTPYAQASRPVGRERERERETLPCSCSVPFSASVLQKSKGTHFTATSSGILFLTLPLFFLFCFWGGASNPAKQFSC